MNETRRSGIDYTKRNSSHFQLQKRVKRTFLLLIFSNKITVIWPSLTSDLNPLHPYMSMHIFHTVFHILLKVLTWRIHCWSMVTNTGMDMENSVLVSQELLWLLIFSNKITVIWPSLTSDLNPLHPYMSMHIFHTVFHILLKVLTWRIHCWSMVTNTGMDMENSVLVSQELLWLLIISFILVTLICDSWVIL